MGCECVDPASSTRVGSRRLLTDRSPRASTRISAATIRSMTRTLESVSGALMTRVDLIDSGMHEREIEHAVAVGHLIRIRRGWYVVASTWNAWWPEDRHLALIRACSRETTGGTGVVSHVSAAALWGLPFYRFSPRTVHMSSSKGIRSSSTSVVTRHDQQVPDDDIDFIEGIPCTSLERTIADALGMVSPEAAVSLVDAALRSVSVQQHRVDLDAAERWRSGVLERLGRTPGARGTVQARWMVGFANGLAQLPGESVSRLQLRRLGFAAPQLQVEVRGPYGQRWFVDFGLDDVNAFGEFDGEGKYIDGSMRGARTIEQVVLDEKRREDWIRGTTQRRFARWGDEHSRTAALLGRRLAEFGIRAP